MESTENRYMDRPLTSMPNEGNCVPGPGANVVTPSEFQSEYTGTQCLNTPGVFFGELPCYQSNTPSTVIGDQNCLLVEVCVDMKECRTVAEFVQACTFGRSRRANGWHWIE